MIGTSTGGLPNNGTGGDCPNYSNIENGHNTVKTCCHSESSEKPSANSGLKNSQKRTNNKNNKCLNTKFEIMCGPFSFIYIYTYVSTLSKPNFS